MRASDLPDWKDIPAVLGMPAGTAWGLFDQDNTKDELGTLNLLTADVVAAAGKEIRCGRSVALNWGLEKMHQAGFGRKALCHTIIDWRTQYGSTSYTFDDEVSINTQTGSQWDGLRHWGHSDTGLYYNGTHHDDLLKSGRLGIENWTRRGGIVGRGVLLDYVAYAARHSIAYSPMSRHPISVAQLEEMAREENVSFMPGDVLIVRTGWTKWYDEHTQAERLEKITNGSAWVGVQGSRESVEWLWNRHFSAVAGDAIGFECWPPLEGYRLHDHLISMWGMPIGEMWDLEVLAEECQKQKRWSFFLTSSPLNTTGGVASPPNSIAVF